MFTGRYGLSAYINQTRLVFKGLMICEFYKVVKEGKAVPLQAWIGPECSRRLRLPDCETVGT